MNNYKFVYKIEHRNHSKRDSMTSSGKFGISLPKPLCCSILPGSWVGWTVNGVLGTSLKEIGLWAVPFSIEEVVIEGVVDMSVDPQYCAGSKFSRSLNDVAVLASILNSLCSLLWALDAVWRRLFSTSGLDTWHTSDVVNQLFGTRPFSHGNVYWKFPVK